jgi:competence protein ComEC
MQPERSIDSAVVAGAALLGGGLCVVAPWETTCGALLLAAAAYLSRRMSRSAALIAGLAMCLGVVRARTAVDRHSSTRALTDALAWQPGRCSALGVIDSSPVSLRGALRFDAVLTHLSCDGAARASALPPLLATLYGGPSDLARGDTVEVIATLAAPQRLWNASSGDPRPGEAHRAVMLTGGALDVRVVLRAKGLLALVDRARARVRRRIDATFAPDLGAMARALVLGESDLSPDDDLSFRASGLSHLLAVSGVHLILVLALAVRGLEELLARIEALAGRWDVGKVAAGFGIVVAWLYAEFAGAGGSTLRAAWMATASLAARSLGKKTDGARAFGISLFAMALADPLTAFDLSFALSAGATAGLLTFARPLSARLERWVPAKLRPVSQAVSTTLAASLPCVPMVARFAPTVPLGGVIANVLAVPLGESAALPLCLVHASLWWWPAAERGCALVASGALVLVRGIARTAAMPAVTASVPQPTPWQLVALGVALGAAALGGRTCRAFACAACAAIVALELHARAVGAPRGVLRATFLDVGQGDAAIIDLPDGEALVVDGGGLVGSPIDVGLRVLAPELRARRRREVLAVVLSHPHPDHFSGLVTGLSDTRIGAFWDTGEGQREGVGGAYATLLASMSARGVAVIGPDRLCGERWIGGVRIDVLAPCPDFSSDRGPNDNSFVLRITYGRRSLLLVGDAEGEEEGILLRSVASRLRADVLKVGHHGSRTSSSSAFLAAVAPKEAIISVGRRNRFGHPHPSTLEALSASGARTWRTDLTGAVTVTTDGDSLEVRSAAQE